jgi:hypothetical protein
LVKADQTVDLVIVVVVVVLMDHTLENVTVTIHVKVQVVKTVDVEEYNLQVHVEQDGRKNKEASIL